MGGPGSGRKPGSGSGKNKIKNQKKGRTITYQIGGMTRTVTLNPGVISNVGRNTNRLIRASSNRVNRAKIGHAGRLGGK